MEKKGKNSSDPSWEEIGEAIGKKFEKAKKDGTWKDCRAKDKVYRNGPSSAIYGLGFVGAVIYYVSTATGFWVGVLGILKSIVWPAFLVYELLRFLGL